MSRTLPCRCGASPFKRVSSRGAASGTRCSWKEARHLTGTLQALATVRNSTGARRRAGLIYCGNPFHRSVREQAQLRVHASRVASGDRPLRVVSPPREPCRASGRRSRGLASTCSWRASSFVIADVLRFARGAGSTCWRPIGPTRFRTAFRTTVIGFAALASCRRAPATSCARICWRGRRGCHVSATFATIVMERVLDLIAVLALLAIYVWGFADPATLPPASVCVRIEVSAALAVAVAVVLHGGDVGARHASRSGSARSSCHAAVAAITAGPPIGWPALAHARSAAVSRPRVSPARLLLRAALVVSALAGHCRGSVGW